MAVVSHPSRGDEETKKEENARVQHERASKIHEDNRNPRCTYDPNHTDEC